MSDHNRKGFTFWPRRLIAFIGVIVPRSVRARWLKEWEAEIEYREALLSRWERLDWRGRLDLLRRSLGAFWDALWLQRLRWEDEMIQDLRYGTRMLRKHRSFTITAVLTLSLGIGASTAIFSFVNALVLRPLPYPDPERLVWVEEVSPQTNTSRPAWGGHFLAWQEHSQSISSIAAINGGTTRTLAGAGEPERVEVGAVSASCLPMLGVQPLPGGRNFSGAEDSPGGARVALLSHALWQRRFGGAPDIVGKAILLDDADFTVIGVLPADFRFFDRYDVWVPLALDAQAQLAGDTRYYGTTVARLKPGITIEQVQAEMDAVQQRYELSRPEGRARIESRTRLIPLQEHLLGERRRPLLILLGAVALLLLIACANVANLMLARALTRQKELSIRAALGAGRFRLVRQLLTECLLLAAAGGSAGLLLAFWLTRLLGSLISSDIFGEMGRISDVTIDRRVLSFTLLISLATGLLFGLLPALQVSRLDLNSTLKEGGRGGGGTHSRGLRGALVIGEVALALVLLVGAGLLIRSFVKLLEVDPGYRAENVLTARIVLPPRYRDDAQRAQFYHQVLERLSALPGVSSAGVTTHLPLTGYNMGSALRVEGRAPQPGEREPAAPVARVSPDYFRTMGIALRAGRLFDDGDEQGAPGVAVLSETLARRLFGNDDPLGKRLGVGGLETTVIGVVNDIRYRGLDGEIEEAVYLSYRQLPRAGMALVLRSAREPASLAPALRQAVREIDPALPVYDVQPMKERLSDSLAARRFPLLLLGGFAALSLLLAGVGVYGVIAYLVGERRHEIGIRLALGAERGDVVRLFMREGMALIALGMALGASAAFALTRVMQSLLFEVSASDPLTFAGVALLLALITLAACYLPARRAARISPLVALRQG